MAGRPIAGRPLEQGHLHLLCGKMASGKSTLAADLAREEHALVLSEDNLLARLYPNEVIDMPTYVDRSSRLKNALRQHIIDLLRRPLVVVLDFPSNTRKQRSWLLGLASEAGVDHTLHYLESSNELCLARLNMRRAAQPDRRDTDTVEMFDAITSFFEPPAADEGASIVIHHQTGSAGRR